MIYNILHLLFGWDYIHWSHAADRGIARVRVDGLGRVWYWRYRSIKLADLIAKPEQVLWLTCAPNKYFADVKAVEGEKT
jgi:hypothetical protein